MPSVMLVREGQTDLSPFGAPDLELARTQWLQELNRRMATLEVEVHHAPDDLEYGGAAALSHNINPLEQAVDEARRMVCALGGEMRRRSEGELPRWLQAQTPSNVARAISAGV